MAANYLYPDDFNRRWLYSQLDSIPDRDLFYLSVLGIWVVIVILYGSWVRIKSHFRKEKDRKIKFREGDSNVHVTYHAINEFLKQRLKAINGVDSVVSRFEQVKDGQLIVEISASLKGVKPIPDLRREIVAASWDALENWMGIPTVQAINVICEDIKYVNRQVEAQNNMLPAKVEQQDQPVEPKEEKKSKSWFSKSEPESEEDAEEKDDDIILEAESSEDDQGEVPSYEIKKENQEAPTGTDLNEGSTSDENAEQTDDLKLEDEDEKNSDDLEDISLEEKKDQK